MTSSIDVEKKIYTWLDEVVIAENFCPFAKSVRVNQQIHLRISKAQSTLRAVDEIMEECDQLSSMPSRETTLVAFAEGFYDFDGYLGLLEEVEHVANIQGFEGIFQFASFHPQYQFEGESVDCVSNYTNRAPYPIVHILREATITKALSHFPNAESIPERNIKHANALGIGFFEQYLKT
ncbi:DUF1415 domain-containing protein [Agaribacter flavus]|uniref:DUF1415 domain-containing protein n=1 Tax=Agaribacter flavus TaxID=1902781 RepID=A0ABV7FSC8_9ALTE